MQRNIPITLAAVAAVAGLIFAAYSTHDFVQHLDRQVHGLQCSFLPGLAAADTTGESGCHVTLMSPYSSVLRDAIWGGIPISLPAMAVFAFLFAFAAFVLMMRRQDDPRATGFLALAWALPVLASVVMGYVSLATLGAACKLCIGIYAASGIGFAAALVSFFLARREASNAPEGEAPASLGFGLLAGALGVGVLFVAVPVAAYAAATPDFSGYVGSCGTLSDPSDEAEVLIALGPQTREVPVIEVLDPLCPACRGFEARFEASSVQAETSRRVLLFPLDDACNWMIDRAIHPGACAISEAVLCAQGDAQEVIDWAFENQEAITAAAKEEPEAAARMARERFPSLARCIGSPTVQARLNQSLRWAVQNELPVLTPQVYVGDLRLCDADTDLGMDFALTRLVERWRTGPRPQPSREVGADRLPAIAAEPPAAPPRVGPARPPAPSRDPAPAPVEAAPVEAAPVEAAPVEAAPVEAPVEAAVEARPLEARPLDARPLEAAPADPAPEALAPEAVAPVEQAPVVAPVEVTAEQEVAP